ncbi:MAG TPA: aldehyde dehydrogenase family protein [Candidatus Acidoferrales bacterium]|nr:aldehyde dehydrogenase family protein [Candidatus Acidoferrales bacterium]
MDRQTDQHANQHTATKHQLFINGEWTDAIANGTYEKTNPFNGKPASTVAAGKREDAKRAIEAAAAAFPAWSSTAPAARRNLLLKAADILDRHQAEIARTTAEETGETFGWGMFNCIFAAGLLREAAAQAHGLIGEIIPSDLPDTVAMATRQAVGVVVGIARNAPMILGMRAVAIPIAYGNTVVLKASEEFPGTHLAIAKVFEEAGFPKGVLNVITNAPADAAEVVDELIAHPQTRRVNFTGSTKVGRIIAEKAGKYLKRILLELGGKAPMIVLADADVDAAVAAANFGAFMNAGQICMSTERIVAEKPIADAFAKKLAAKAGSLKVGDPLQPDTQIGSVINKGAASRVQELIDDAVAKGAKVLCGGRSDGNCYSPTVLFGVTPKMRIYGEESFGPVVSVVVADTDEEALRIANDTEYGLSSAIFSRDVNKAMRFAERMQTGICHINGSTVHDEPHMPFGGKAALEEFTELRWITIRRTPTHYPI